MHNVATIPVKHRAAHVAAVYCTRFVSSCSASDGAARLRRDEIGEYYAIDIGGTNFRSIHATLSDKKGELVSCAILPVSHPLCALRCNLSAHLRAQKPV